MRLSGVAKPCFDDWIARKVIVPLRPWGGRGRPAEYDAANVVTLRLALALRAQHVVVRHWGPGFQELTAWLRETPEADWRKHRVVVRADTARFSRMEFPLQVVGGAFVYELARLIDDQIERRPAGRSIKSKRAE